MSEDTYLCPFGGCITKKFQKEMCQIDNDKFPIGMVLGGLSASIQGREVSVLEAGTSLWHIMFSR